MSTLPVDDVRRIDRAIATHSHKSLILIFYSSRIAMHNYKSSGDLSYYVIGARSKGLMDENN